MYRVYVQDKDGRPLDPTIRFGKVRRMLDTGLAICVRRRPFTIRLAYEIENAVVHPCTGGTDPGRENIGTAVMRPDNGCVVYTDHVTTANKQVPEHMSSRAQARRASRRGERLARKRLAKKHGTLSTKLDNGRAIAGCGKPVPVKDIVNTEARFRHRVRHGNMADVLDTDSGWVTPSARQLVLTHLNHVRQVTSVIPVTDWCLEINRFAFMRMEDGTVRGVDFQNGRMKGYASVNDYVYALQDGKCACCGKPIDACHHIVPRHEGGSDGPDNRIGLCAECHHKVHTGELDIDTVGMKQKYGALSVLNQAVPLILEGLEQMFGKEHVHTCTGWETSRIREAFGIDKDHPNDAVAIIAACTGTEPYMGDAEHFEIRQFRRHDRAVVKSQRERTYKLKGKTVAKNRKPRKEQKTPALSQWYAQTARQDGVRAADGMRSRMQVTKSTRYYNRKGKTMPGMAFLYEGKRYVMRGQLTNGQYYQAVGTGKQSFPASAVRVLVQNVGLVYV